MKKTLIVLLGAALLLGALSGCNAAAPAEIPVASSGDGTLPVASSGDGTLPVASSGDSTALVASSQGADTPPMTLKEVEDQSFSLAMACWLSEEEGLLSELTLWDAVGWHAARQRRIDGTELISHKEAKTFLRSLGGYTDDLPASWEEYGVVKVVLGAGSSRNYDFSTHKSMFDAMLGVDTEVSLSLGEEPNTVEAVITVHYEDGQVIEHRFLIYYMPAEAGSAYPYALQWVDKTFVTTRMDPRLNFTMDLLMEQNSLDFILRSLPGLRVRYDSEEDWETWIFEHNGHLAKLSRGGLDYVSGSYGPWSFERERTNGVWGRTLVTDRTDEEELRELYESTNKFPLADVEYMEFLEEAGDLYRVRCRRSGSLPDIELELDKGLLTLRSAVTFYENPEPWEVHSSIDYPDPEPVREHLEAWDEELRAVTVYWEDFDEETQSLTHRREVLKLPRTWEYLPDVVRWGEYTAYMNEDYTKPYKYPGNGRDYTVYFTVTKG